MLNEGGGKKLLVSCIQMRAMQNEIRYNAFLETNNIAFCSPPENIRSFEKYVDLQLP